MRISTSRFAAIAGTVLCWISCNTATAAQDEHQSIPAAQEHSRHGEDVALPAMRLDAGKKWQMDDHTRTLFKKMESDFAQADHSSLEGLRSIGGTLKGELDTLIKGCTMTGDAHTMLQVYLTDYMTAVDDLATAPNVADGRTEAVKIKGYLDRYDDYFE